MTYLFDDYVLIEARRNLAMKGPAALGAFEALLAGLRVCEVQAIVHAQIDLDWLPEKDRPVMAAAMLSRCDVLLTGDRTHFGTAYGKVFGGVAIHSPRSLAEVLFG